MQLSIYKKMQSKGVTNLPVECVPSSLLPERKVVLNVSH